LDGADKTGLVGASVAEQVRRVDVEARGGKRWDQGSPVLAARAEAVQQQKRLARRPIGRPGIEGVNAIAVYNDVLAAHARAPEAVANLPIVDPQRIPVKRSAGHKGKQQKNGPRQPQSSLHPCISLNLPRDLLLRLTYLLDSKRRVLEAANPCGRDLSFSNRRGRFIS